MENILNIPKKSDIKRVLKLDNVKEIPSFPPVAAKLLEICSNDDTEMADLSKIVGTDPGISSKLLGIANSAFYGLKQKITTASDAVIFLGFDEVKRLSLGISVFEKMFKSGQQLLFDRLFFWRHCLCVASLSLALAEEIQYSNPGEAYTGGLLHDLGKIIFDLRGCVNYSDFITTMATSTGQMIDRERELMGMGHDDLGVYYSSLWHLPDPIALTIKYHHQQFGHLNLSKKEQQLVSIVSLANFLSWTQGMGSVDIVRPPILQPEVEKNIDLNKIDFIKLINRVDREMEHTATFYNFVFPSPSQFRENLLRANLNLCRINTSYYFNGKQIKTVDVTSIKDSITTPHKSLDPEKIIATTLKAIYNDFQFNRLYVMTVIKKLRRLKVIEFLDTANTKMDLKSIDIPLNKTSGGFIECLRNQKPEMITGKTIGEKKALEQFGIKEMVIVPFCSHKKVIGILGMDNIKSQNAILPDVLSAIAIVANELGMAMENAGMYKEAKAISLRDGLTGLLNRTAIDDLLAKSFRKAVGKKAGLSLVMLDVDFFKKFNDKFGHQAGDNILKLISTALKKLSRPFDHVGRYGGEEFIVILNDTNLKKAIVYAERIRKEIENLGGLLSNRFPGLSLTVSAGVSEYHKGIKNQDSLIAAADKALYKAKETGRNKVVSG